MASATHATFENTAHPHFILGEIWFKYQNNKQNLKIWDVQVLQNARF